MKKITKKSLSKAKTARKLPDLLVKKGDKVKGGGGLHRTGGTNAASITGASISA